MAGTPAAAGRAFPEGAAPAPPGSPARGRGRSRSGPRASCGPPRPRASATARRGGGTGSPGAGGALAAAHPGGLGGRPAPGPGRARSSSLPTPEGPVKSQAWCNVSSRRAARSAWTARGCPWTSEKAMSFRGLHMLARRPRRQPSLTGSPPARILGLPACCSNCSRAMACSPPARGWWSRSLGLQALSGDTQFRGTCGAARRCCWATSCSARWTSTEGERLPDGPPQGARAGLDAGADLRLHPAERSSLLLKVVRSRSRPTPKILRDVLDVTLYLVATLVIVQREFNLDLSSLLAGSAIISVVIGLALQETLGNLFAGLAIQLERPFQVGDIIAVGDQVFGRIVQIGWRATRVENKRREIISLPNTTFSKQGVKNYSRGGEPVGVDTFVELSYDTPPEPGEGGHPRDAGRGAAHPLRARGPDPDLVAYEDSDIKYRIRFYVADIARANRVRDEILTRLWYRLRREGIEVPYHQRVVHLRFPDEQAGGVPGRRAGRAARRGGPVPGARGRPSASGWRTRWCPAASAAESGSSSEGDPGQTFYVVGRRDSVSILTGRGVEVTRLGPREVLRRDVAAHRRAPLGDRGGRRGRGALRARPADLRPALRRAAGAGGAALRGAGRPARAAPGGGRGERERGRGPRGARILDRLRSIFGLRA